MSQLTTVATTMTAMPHSACSGRVPRRSRRTASTSKPPPTTAMTAVWRSPARFSALPCPKGCPSSAGESAIRIDRRLKLEMRDVEQGIGGGREKADRVRREPGPELSDRQRRGGGDRHSLRANLRRGRAATALMHRS